MLLDKGLESYVNEFTIHMLPPTTQEEIDRRDSLSSKVQIINDIMNMLGDVDDVSVRLKILKNLLANVVTDPEVITELQDYIEKLESELPTPPEENETEEGSDIGGGFGGSSGGFEGESGDLNAELLGAEASETGDASSESGEDVLPSGDDLGIDLTDTDIT